MGQAFYRKYRSRSLDEVIGQEHITTTLKKALKLGRISHAYLFTGPRGVGKTSVARILAHEINNLTYDGESTHLDIIEIDAASNRRIDEIRDLREKVHILPTIAKYKVYIIDEVHMLTREAFNALLKTLEEPPKHCVFILATTEFHKLPETIVSRTQRFNFKPIGEGRAHEHLAMIAKQEKIEITSEAIGVLAQYGDGSFRDSIGLLDQLGSLDSKIDEQTVREFLGLPPEVHIEQIIDSIKEGNGQEIIKILDQLLTQGTSPATTARFLSNKLRERLVYQQTDLWIPILLRELLEVPASLRPQDLLEIAVLEAAANNFSAKNSGARLEQSKSPDSIVNAQDKLSEQPLPDFPNKRITPKPSKKTALPAKRDFSLKLWPDILTQIKNEAPPLYTVLRLAQPQFSNNTLNLIFQFPLHHKKVGQGKQIATLEQIIKDHTGKKIIVHTLVDKELAQQLKKRGPDNEISATQATPSTQSTQPLDVISNIFGAAEVLES